MRKAAGVVVALCLLPGCVYTQYSNYQDVCQDALVATHEQPTREEIVKIVREFLAAEWTAIDTETGDGMVTRWKATRDRRGGYLIPTPLIVAVGRINSGTPGAYRVRATISPEKPYRVTLAVEGRRLKVLDGTPADAQVTQADVDKVAQGIRCYLMRDLAPKLPAATAPGTIRM